MTKPVAEFTTQLNEDESTLVLQALFAFLRMREDNRPGWSVSEEEDEAESDEICDLIHRLTDEFDAHVRKTLGE